MNKVGDLERTVPTALMIVLLGEFNGNSKAMPYLRRHGWGRMWSSYGPDWEYDNEPWGFDNGAWSAYKSGKPWSAKRFLRRMEMALRLSEDHAPIVAALPDVVGNAVNTLNLVDKWIDRLPEWSWFLVLQDGMTEHSVLPFITDQRIHGLFLGGTDEFKSTAARWCRFAHRFDKRFHFGRCSREQWIRNAIEIGADSMDSTRPVKQIGYGEPSGVRWFRMFETLVTGQCPQKTLSL